MPVPAQCEAIADEVEELKQERNALQTELQSAPPGRKRGLVSEIKHLNSSIDAKTPALDACVAQYGGSQPGGSQPPLRRSVLAGTLTVRISPIHGTPTGTTMGNMDLVVERAVHLMLDFSPDGRVVTLLSGWPTVVFDDSAPLSPASMSLRVSLSGNSPGTIDPAGHVTLPMVLHVDYDPNAGLWRSDQDIDLTLTSAPGSRIWEEAPNISLSASVTYETVEFLWRRVSHTLGISLTGTVNPPPAPYPADETVWFDGALPDGARPHADNDRNRFGFELLSGWAGSLPPIPLPPNYPPPPPGRANGLLVHGSHPLKTGMSQHYFDGAGQTLTVAGGERLFAYVYLLAAELALLDEIMLQWNDGTWAHRAFWGADLVRFGDTGTVSQRRIGELPSAGVWTRLEVPAADVGLEGRTLNGMAFTMNTRVGFSYCHWGRAGKLS